MVQTNLSDNSKVTKGKYFKDKTGSKNLRKVNVYRWDPSTGENPRIEPWSPTDLPKKPQSEAGTACHHF